MEKSLVDLCLELNEKSLNWTVELSPDQTIEFLKKSKEYIGMNNLAGMVEKINKIIPTKLYPGDNPNNNQPHHNFSVGNECSRVVYLKIVKAYLKGGLVKWGEGEFLNLQSKIKGLAKKAGADEISCEDTESSLTFRFWWD